MDLVARLNLVCSARAKNPIHAGAARLSNTGRMEKMRFNYLPSSFSNQTIECFDRHLY